MERPAGGRNFFSAVEDLCSGHTGMIMMAVRPEWLNLEVTDKCTMRCPMCITRLEDFREELPLDLAEIRDRVLRPAREKGLKHLVLSGGEPTVSPLLSGILNEAKDLDYTICLATNLWRLERADLMMLLQELDDPCHVLQVSYDSWRADEMERIRGVPAYDGVTANLHAALELRRQHGFRWHLHTVTVAQEDNATSLRETVRVLLDDMGVDCCVVQPRSNYSKVTLANFREQPPSACSPTARAAILEEVASLFELAKTERRLLVLGENASNWDRFYEAPLSIPPPCRSPNIFFVGANGDVRGCLFSPVIGNLRWQGIEECLTSPAYQDFLRLTQQCKICINGCS